MLFVHNGAPYEAHVKHLRDAGIRVTEAHAEEAVRVATTQQPDIVVLDFGCDGEVTRAFKDDPETQHIPVIALVEMLKR